MSARLPTVTRLPASAVRVLAPGRSLPYSASAQHPEVFSIVLARGECVRLRLEELHNLELAQLKRPGHPLGVMRFRDAGRHAILHITLIADTTGEYRLELTAYEKHQRASGLITASAVGTTTARDREIAAAQTLLARAEWSRHEGSSATWPRALADYRAVARTAGRLGDTTLLRMALTGESRLTLYQLNDYQTALTLAKEAVAVPDGERDVPGEALAWKSLGSADYFLARYGAAIRDDRRALGLYRQTADRYWQDIVLGNLAYAYREVGRTSLALATARRSLALAKEVGDTFGVDFTLEELGDFHLARGELDRAFADYRRALAALRAQPYPLEAGAVWNGLGELFEVASDEGAAQEAFAKALELSEGAHDSSGALEILGNLAEVSLRRGNPRAAMDYYRQAIGRAKALHLRRDQSLLLTGLGRALAAFGHRRKALAAYREAIALAARISADDAAAAAWQGLGDEAARAGSMRQAQAAYERAVELWSRQSDRVHMATALASLARLKYRQGRLRAAHVSIERALALIAASRESLTSRALRTSYFASQHAYYDLGISILMALGRRARGSGDDLKALQLAERARARSLLDALDRADRLPSRLIPVSLAESLRRNREEVDAAYARWGRLVRDPHAGAGEFDALHTRIESLLRAGDELEALAQARSRRYARVSGAHPASIGRLQRQVLEPGSALLEYWVGRNHSYAWLIRRRGISTLTLPGGSLLEKETGALRRAITARTVSVNGESLAARLTRVRAADARAEALAASLGAQILPDCSRLSRLHTLYVVADGPLFGVPFPALKARGCPGSLIETTAVLEEPSASVLMSLERPGTAHAPPGSSPNIAVFADPVYGRDDPRLKASMAQAPGAPVLPRALGPFTPEARMADLPRLAGSRAEALDIERLSGSGDALVRTGFAATVSAVRATDWRRFEVGDFAVHTLVNAASPAFSGLVLTLFHRDGAPEDGVLWLRDIYHLDIPVDLVVLSGCRTLGGRSVPGEGLVGLYRAFLMAGAHAVLGSLWSVEDRPTGRLMGAFYQDLLRRHMSPAQALRAAQGSLAGSRRFAALYYWAGFSIEGAGNGVI